MKSAAEKCEYQIVCAAAVPRVFAWVDAGVSRTEPGLRRIQDPTSIRRLRRRIHQNDLGAGFCMKDLYETRK